MRIRNLEDDMIFQTDKREKGKPVVFLEIDGVTFALDLEEMVDLAYLITAWAKVSLEGEEW